MASTGGAIAMKSSARCFAQQPETDPEGVSFFITKLGNMYDEVVWVGMWKDRSLVGEQSLKAVEAFRRDSFLERP
jgi:hypothetical protein